MKACRIVWGLLLLLGAAALVRADERDRKGVQISDKSFRQIASAYLNDPGQRSARDWARLILVYTMQTSNATVVLGSEELQWVGLGSDEQHSLPLLAAYAAGNIQAQLHSGVKRNDRYSGLLTLFYVYRTLREQDDKIKNAALDRLLELHRQGKLLEYVRKLDEEKPTKLSPADERAIRKLMEKR